jgi:hypothetical protein
MQQNCYGAAWICLHAASSLRRPDSLPAEAPTIDLSREHIMKTAGFNAVAVNDDRDPMSTPVLVAALGLLLFGILWAVAVFCVVQSRAEIRQDMGLQKLGWREIAWPFPRDAFPAGRAFRCQQASCGEGSELYVRAKPGLCNSKTGVADDEEVDRVADLDLVGTGATPEGTGQVGQFGDFVGRSRSYDLRVANGSHASAVGVALSRRSDMIVAVVKGTGPTPLLQQAVQQFFVSNDVQRWMVSALNGM